MAILILMNETQIEAALVTLNAAMNEHATLVAAKCRALGVSVGSVGAMALNTDAEIVAAYDRMRIADLAYCIACGE